MASPTAPTATLTLLGALCLVWAGVVGGVSFLAVPAKFAAPSLALPVALDVGRQEFAVLNRVELVFVALTLLFALVSRPGPLLLAGLVLVAMIVTAQTSWLLPVLDARVQIVLDGGTPPPAPWHWIYVAVETLKLVCLLFTGWVALVIARRRVGSPAPP